jgi:hypothetical protein
MLNTLLTGALRGEPQRWLHAEPRRLPTRNPFGMIQTGFWP